MNFEVEDAQRVEHALKFRTLQHEFESGVCPKNWTHHINLDYSNFIIHYSSFNIQNFTPNKGQKLNNEY